MNVTIRIINFLKVFIDIPFGGWYYIMRMPHDFRLKFPRDTRIGE